MGTDGFHCVEKRAAIAFNVVLAVVLGQAKIERLAAIAARNAALPGAEAVNQPGQ
jgi:hypothetical protein